MREAIIWGLVQGLTEFLPISSSGHLVLVPAFLDLEPPDLATSAVLHLGTLVAVVAYYRRDLARLLRFRTDREARKVVTLLVIGTIPAVIGVVVEDAVASFQESEQAVSVALIVTGLVLFGSGWLVQSTRRLEEGTAWDALVVGVAQALALIPGISRSGMTITAGMARRFDPVQAARFSFLLAIPAIAGAGILQGAELMSEGGVPGPVWVGVAVAAVSGYAAIALLLRLITNLGLRPYALYAIGVGAVGLIVL